MNGWTYLIIAIIAEVIGSTGLKASSGFTKIIPSLVVIAGYVVAFYFFSLSLKTIPLGVGYAVWSGLGVVLIALMGVIFLKESLTVPAMIGMLLIVCGVVVLNLFGVKH
jgi:small multidrug resistance pump